MVGGEIRTARQVYAMNPTKVDRAKVSELTDLPNIGKTMAGDLQSIGIHEPAQLIGKSAYDLYDALCAKTGSRHDPCVIDAFLSITHFMAGDDPKVWWAYTAERKEHFLDASSHRRKSAR